MTTHVCACYTCNPVRFPRFVTRQSEGHAAVALGDAHKGAETTVFLDGEPLTRCIEAFAGRDGVAIVVSPPVHYCGCGRPVCLTRLTGRVELRRVVSR